MNKKRLKFGLKPVFALAAIVAATIPIVQWLRTDTIFYADTSIYDNAPFIIRFPDGRTIETNRWFRRTNDLEFSLLGTDQAGQFNIVQNFDSSTVATINYDGRKYIALVTGYRIRGPGYRGEYWLTFGKEIGIVMDDTKATEP